MSGVVVLGNGFVGGAVVAALHERVEVAVLDLPTHPGLFDRTERSADLIRSAIASVDAAAVVNACGLLRGTSAELTSANESWPTWLVQSVLAGSGARFVHIGSASEYGDPGDDRPISEDRPVHPNGDYATSKAAGSLAVVAARRAGLDATVARVFNLVGPALSPTSPLHQFLTDVTALPPTGGEIELWWPDTVRDYVLLEDLGAAVAALALADVSEDIVNVCSGVGISFGRIAQAMAAAQNKPLRIRSLDRPGIATVIGDPTRLRDLTGITPTISAELIAQHATLTPHNR